MTLGRKLEQHDPIRILTLIEARFLSYIQAVG